MADIINILPDSVANQIAAGEVVDRPASAVKELIENALDAGATAIQLIVKDAGRTLIQVIDNGCGMSDSDARRCFERHATSKIHKADDLFDILTMGFRGEALASIGAVAQVELRTRQHDSQLGTQVVIHGAQLVEQTPCTTPPGTSIAVKNLFYNIPARRNFLKRDSIELAHIEEMFKRIALPNYNIAFSFHHNGRLLYDLKASNFAQRIAAIFGNNYSQRIYHIEETTEPVRINGYIGKAEYAKRVRGEQFLFVNKRYIRHPGLSAAIERAYTELIPQHTYPAYFVMLELDPSRIDINIHPAKTEARFIDEQVIFGILRAATKKALGQFTLANEIEFNPSTEIDFTPAAKGYVPQAPKIAYNPNYNPFRSTESTESTMAERRLREIPQLDFADAKEELPAEEPIAIGNRFDIIQFPPYIVTTLKSGIVLIHRRRALERIHYERLIANKESNKAAPQQLLFPISCRFTNADSQILNELLPTLTQVGFIIAALGTNNYVVSATPPNIKESQLQALLEQTLDDYKSSLLGRAPQQQDTICLSLARQMAAHADMPTLLTPEEVQQLVADLFSCTAPDVTPSGQATMRILKPDEIAMLLQEHAKL